MVRHKIVTVSSNLVCQVKAHVRPKSDIHILTTFFIEFLLTTV